MLAAALLTEFDREMGTTRRLLERAPADAFGWRPHEKSMTLGELAQHLATLPRWTDLLLEGPGYDLAAGGREDLQPPASRAALLDTFDRSVADMRTRLTGLTDPELLVPWTLRRDGHELFTLPRLAALRSFVLNHAIHHRGQLSVYLRLRDVPLPPLYGPTADEGLEGL